VSAGLDGNVILSRAADRRGKRTLQDHTAAVECLAASADGALLASGSRDGKVRLHRADGGRLVRTWQRLGAAVTALAWDDDRRRFVAGLQDGSLCVLAADSDAFTRAAAGAEAIHAVLAVGGGSIVAGFARCWTVPR
jgi:WD40 repeat protein